MIKLNTAVASVMPLLSRSCARCGGDFKAAGREYICPTCRKPKVPVRTPAKQGLSFREQQIVALIQQAKTNKQIAFELRLTEGTVKEYLHQIFRKTNVRSRTELALRSYDLPADRPKRATAWSEMESLPVSAGQPSAALS